MAFDMNDKPWSPSQIAKSTYDETDNAVRVLSVGGSSGGGVPVQSELLVDSANGTIFIRNYVYDTDGVLDSTSDMTLAGVTYVLVGTASPLQAQDSLTGPVFRDFHDYSSVNVTTAAYVELIASTSVACKQLEIFDSSGQLLILALGAAASEVDKLYILPGGNGQVICNIPAGTRVSIKAVSASATAGYLAINFIA